MTADERKQAEEILQSYWDNFTNSVWEASLLAMEAYASLKVAEATKEMYPKEFMDWVAKNCFLHEEEDLWLYDWSREQEQFMQSFTTDELFEYWKQNIRK